MNNRNNDSSSSSISKPRYNSFINEDYMSEDDYQYQYEEDFNYHDYHDEKAFFPPRASTNTFTSTIRNQHDSSSAKCKESQNNYNNDDDLDNGASDNKKIVPPPFPVKLHKLLQDANQAGFSDIISWQEGRDRCHPFFKNIHNKSSSTLAEQSESPFKIHDSDRFANEIMPKYFAQCTKLKSFHRQLNIYGFKRIHVGPFKGGYSHSLFQRLRPELCEQMSRKTPTRVRKGGQQPPPASASSRGRRGQTARRNSINNIHHSNTRQKNSSAPSASMIMKDKNRDDTTFFEGKRETYSNVTSNDITSDLLRLDINTVKGGTNEKATHDTTEIVPPKYWEDYPESLRFGGESSEYSSTSQFPTGFSSPTNNEARTDYLEGPSLSDEEMDLQLLAFLEQNILSDDDDDDEADLYSWLHPTQASQAAESSKSSMTPRYVPLLTTTEEQRQGKSGTWKGYDRPSSTSAFANNSDIKNKNDSQQRPNKIGSSSDVSTTNTDKSSLSRPLPPNSISDEISQDKTCFPHKLYTVLQDAEKDGFAHIISWVEDGNAFMVYDQKAFVDRIMPHYFDQTKYESFRRQLNLYGFKRISKGDQRGIISHSCFKRNMPSLRQYIVRQPVKGTRGAGRAGEPPAASVTNSAFTNNT